MTEKGITPRDIVTPASLRNAVTVVMAMGGSTNVALHASRSLVPPASTSGTRS